MYYWTTNIEFVMTISCDNHCYNKATSQIKWWLTRIKKVVLSYQDRGQRLPDGMGEGSGVVLGSRETPGWGRGGRGELRQGLRSFGFLETVSET